MATDPTYSSVTAHKPIRNLLRFLRAVRLLTFVTLAADQNRA